MKKVQLQEQYTLVTQDSIGHLKTLCMSVLFLAVALESEWKYYSLSQSDEKTLAFEYEFSLNAFITKDTSVRIWITKQHDWGGGKQMYPNKDLPFYRQKP